MKKISVVFGFALLSGCTSVINPYADQTAYTGLNPPRTHVTTSELVSKEPIKAFKAEIGAAEKDLLTNYFAALTKAKEVDKSARAAGRYASDSRTIDEVQPMVGFADAGIAVVDTMCLRWFHSLMESQLRLNYASANRNVLKDLGTALLGIGAAGQDVVAVYGAMNTAASGWERNLSQAFLLAPNANKIKSHVFMALSARATELKKSIKVGPGSRATFAKVYSDLEQYADLCTQHTAREIMNTALDQTKTTVQPDEAFRVSTSPTEGAVSQAMTNFTEAQKQILEQLKDSAKSSQAVADLSAELQKLRAENAALTERLKSIAPTDPGAVQPPPTP